MSFEAQARWGPLALIVLGLLIAQAATFWAAAASRHFVCSGGSTESGFTTLVCTTVDSMGGPIAVGMAGAVFACSGLVWAAAAADRKSPPA